jgi:hypothetical protein
MYRKYFPVLDGYQFLCHCICNLEHMTAWYTASCVQLTITLEEILIAFACYANGIYIKKPWKQLTKFMYVLLKFG